MAIYTNNYHNMPYRNPSPIDRYITHKDIDNIPWLQQAKDKYCGKLSWFNLEQAGMLAYADNSRYPKNTKVALVFHDVAFFWDVNYLMIIELNKLFPQPKNY